MLACAQRSDHHLQLTLRLELCQPQLQSEPCSTPPELLGLLHNPCQVSVSLKPSFESDIWFPLTDLVLENDSRYTGLQVAGRTKDNAASTTSGEYLWPPYPAWIYIKYYWWLFLDPPAWLHLYQQLWTEYYQGHTTFANNWTAYSTPRWVVNTSRNLKRPTPFHPVKCVWSSLINTNTRETWDPCTDSVQMIVSTSDLLTAGWKVGLSIPP